MGTPSNDNQWTPSPEPASSHATASRNTASFSDVFDSLGFTDELVFTPGVILHYVTQILVGDAGYLAVIVGGAYIADYSSIDQAKGAAAGSPDAAMFAIMAAMFAYVACWAAFGLEALAPVREAARDDHWASRSPVRRPRSGHSPRAFAGPSAMQAPSDRLSPGT